MKLIGMMDSPYVRRTAIGLDALGVEFEHEAVSVFSHFERFRSINPVVKAPTLVLNDGTVMMDSSLILEFFESQSSNSLWAKDADERCRETKAVSYALAACEKSVQTVYERNLRPKEHQYGPWIERVSAQRNAAFSALENEVTQGEERFSRLSQASIIAAIVFQFAQSELGSEVDPTDYPGLAEHAARMEALPVFLKYPPIGPGVQAS
jgi:glutathione S-transferase